MIFTKLNKNFFPKMNNLNFAIVIKMNDEVIDKKKGQLMKKILILAGIVGLMSATQVFA